ncbi:hypothetical protein GCM10011273_14440 [Asticcacaulis endophyticus]|uniref:Uncharacterized protein n=2 Tax=Asticcacaulis endophyticus TaxID=1395890 RepID=A0A918US35_9CAUL|nr:hypothetical protein GCM10011273_14440 [Asticcacaulis endophyticus]
MACETECIVIKQMINGKVIDRLQYSPNTIIGAAFDDAKAGYLASPDALIPKEASEINSAHRILTPADRTRETARLKQSEADAKKADELIKAYFPEYENCRGGADGAEITISACAEKEVIASKLKAMGYCISGVSPGWSKC